MVATISETGSAEGNHHDRYAETETDVLWVKSIHRRGLGHCKERLSFKSPLLERDGNIVRYYLLP